jgi:hypothetical protein
LRYGAGVLFPRAATFDKADSTSSDEDKVLEKIEEEKKNTDNPVKTEDSKAPVDMSEDFEEEIGLANSFLPSAMGFSCFSQIPKDGFKVKANVAVYEIKKYSTKKMNSSNSKLIIKFLRPGIYFEQMKFLYSQENSLTVL